MWNDGLPLPIRWPVLPMARAMDPPEGAGYAALGGFSTCEK